MTEPVVSQSRLQVGMRDGISDSLPAINIDPIGSLLEVHRTIVWNDLFLLPALAEGTEDPHHVGQQNGSNDQAVVDARLAEVDLAAGNGGQPAPNEQLQHMEQEDLHAVRNILPKWPTLINVITGRHFYPVLKQLRDNLPDEGSHGMPYAQEYARVLHRLARVIMTIPSEQEYESAHCAHCTFPLDYGGLVKVVEDMVSGFLCPLDYGEFLGRLLKDMTASSSVMRVGDGVYVVGDRDDYARRLRSLAALVLRCV